MSGTITAHEFDLIRNFIEQESSISLADDKVYLVETRLSAIMKDAGISDYLMLHRALKDPAQRHLYDLVIDAMTTNETLWFRDTSPFDVFRDHLLPAYASEIREGKRDRIRIWSAASSTGQEAYSMAMVFAEFIRQNPFLKMNQLEILGTDLSDTALAKARSGKYGGIAMDRGLPREFKDRYFTANGNAYDIKPDIRQRVEFRKFNLQDSFAAMGQFDIILTRYVLIYFQDDFKREVLRKAHGCLEPGGVLFVGSSESLPDATPGYSMVRRGQGTWYQRVDLGRGQPGLSAAGTSRPSQVAVRSTAPKADSASKESSVTPEKSTHDLTDIMQRLKEMNEKHRNRK